MDGPLPASALVAELDRIARDEGCSRKVLMGRTRGEGRELLAQVARRGTPWAGFELWTARSLASEIVRRGGHLAERSVVDAFDEQALIERAIDDELGGGRLLRHPELVERVGLRDAVRRSVTSLRLGGAGVRALARRQARASSRRRRIAGVVLRRYEELLERGGMADGAMLLEAAAEAVRRDSASLLRGARVLLLPGLTDRGLPGSFARSLLERGATLLATDPVEGLPTPEGLHWRAARPVAPGSWLHRPAAFAGERPQIELFAAASVADELRGVLRRATAKGARWDEVEIVATDPLAYGSVLHSIAEPLGIPATYAVGLSVERTRPGRVAAAYFRWVESDFQEARLRALIEANDVKPPDPGDGIPGSRLARSLRRLRIGWGRARYMDRIGRALGPRAEARPRPDESEEARARRARDRREELLALRALVGPVLAATPPVDGRVSPAEVAVGVRALLERVAPGTETDAVAGERLARQLDRIEATLHRVTDYPSAAATVRGFLQLRVPAPRAEGLAPWGSAPGHLYVTDLDHGGAAGRRYTAIVGMDAGRLPGRAREDPLLLDGERRRLGGEALSLASQRVSERRFGFAQLVARLRGDVSMSYTRWNPAEARELPPAPEMLQALRLREGDSSLDFEALQRHLGPSESRLPRAEISADLDEADVWLRALATPDGRLRDGRAAIARAYPRLGRGRAVRAALGRDAPSVHTGFLPPPAPGQPFRDFSEWTFSATSLGNLGACPRRFLLASVLGASPPDDPEFDPDRWLNPLQRGTLLHSVYERSLALARERKLNIDDDVFLALALSEVERASAETLHRVPTPSALVQELEVEALRDDARSFVDMVRSDPPAWTRLEMTFGGPGDPVAVDAAGSTVRVRGIVDRVDEGEDGLRVIDYKTGRSASYDKDGPFAGGRRLQGYVYVEAARAALGQPVASMEHHFPTRRGENRAHRIDARELGGGGGLVAKLIESAAKGRFPATENTDDCRSCDYGVVCGVNVNKAGWGKPSCHFSDWTRRNLGSLPALDSLHRVRSDPWEVEP